MTFKTWDRYSLESLSLGEQDRRGRLFMSSLGQVNLGAVNILREGVDTIRQLYQGSLKSDVLEQIKHIYNLGPSRRFVDVLGKEWLLGSGGKSGYRYRLQDSDLGVILFISSRHNFETSPGPHLKIELSPHFIDARNTQKIQTYMDNLAALLLADYRPTGCAVHLCVDVQGWQPPKNLADNLISRARRRVDHVGIGEAEFSLSEVAVIYGASQSFLFGSASGLQFSLYRKDLQAKAIDKIHFWESAWNRRTNEDFQPLYDPSKPVWRFEYRYHHSVINEFAVSLGQSINTFTALVPHLTGLFRYGLTSFRLNAMSSSASKSASFYRGLYIDPFWQLLMQDVQILAPDSGLTYKREPKKPGQGGRKNLLLAVGNLMSIHARNGLTPMQSLRCLMSAGLWQDYAEYIRSSINQVVSDKVVESKALERVTESLKLRVFQGAFA